MSAKLTASHRTFPHVLQIATVTDGTVAEPAAAVRKGPLHDGVHSKAQRNDGQSTREFL